MATNVPMVATVSPNAGGKAALLEFEALVRKLSNAGLSLSVTPEVDAALSAYDEISVSLRLPGQNRLYTLACVVRHRSPLDDIVIYGCEYDWTATMDPLGVVEDLLDFVLDEPGN
jgi:hypothetical protein